MTPKIPLVFYRGAAGKELVREWLRELPQPDRLAIGADLQRVQYRWPIGMPLCRPLGDGLWEVRANLPSKATARVFLCCHGETLYALHAFIKKMRKTPGDELAIARKRKQEVENG